MNRLRPEFSLWVAVAQNRGHHCAHIKSTKRYGCAPIVLTAEEKKEIVTGAANPDHLLNSSAPPAQTALLPTSKHPSAPITTPVHHHSSSTVVYSLYATHSSV